MPDLRLTWRPECYHGDGKRPPFFEGWYFKLVDAVARQRFAVIPGVFLADEPGASHSFIQTLDGLTGRTTIIAIPWTRSATLRVSWTSGSGRTTSGKMAFLWTSLQRNAHCRASCISPL